MFADDFFLMGSILNPKYCIYLNNELKLQYDFDATILRNGDAIRLANSKETETKEHEDRDLF